MDLILATDNLDKVREFRQMLPDPPIHILTMRQAGFQGVIDENGTSYEENALIKARAVHRQTGGTVLADDSGLSIDVLDGAPGLYSARFAGEDADYPAKIARLYDWLRGYEPSSWQARFVCALALIWPDGQEQTVTGICPGHIAPEPRGSHGFGYDPIFMLPDGSQTMAELADEDKHRISHRGRALAALRQILLDRLGAP